MPSIPQIRNANATAAQSLSYRPVAIFVGGTAGIGAGMARAFAEHRNGDAHIIVVGRNQAAAQELIASFPKPEGEEAEHEFVQCDVTLMRNVRETTTELLGRLPKVNFLVLSQGILTTRGRDETEEGIDRKLALHYYSRWRFTYDLVPLLQKAVDAHEDAKVMTVLDGVRDGFVDLDDLGLKKNYTVGNAAMHATAYNSIMIQSFAEKHPGVASTHVSPGVVRTDILKGSNDWKLRMLSPLMELLGPLVGVSASDCAEYMWKGVWASKAGWYRKDSHGEEVNVKSSVYPPEAGEQLWEHTLKATS